ncbi:MAG: imidazole glycerol phosphate synthase subunit HisF [Planctomycetota bacterium]
MSLARRIIACLDVAEGRVVKGTKFQDLKDQGSIATLSQRYRDQGADELVFLDVGASAQGRDTQKSWVREAADSLDIPFCVGGGIRTLEDMRHLLSMGVDKVSLSTAAVEHPSILDEASREFGSQFVVLSMDARQEGSQWRVTKKGGREDAGRELLSWAREAEERGAGEIMLNIMDADGTRQGYALEITHRVAQSAGIPVIASGGAGSDRHVVELFRNTAAQAALVAGILHDGTTSVYHIKQACLDAGIVVRP